MSDPFSIALGVVTVIDVTAKCAKTLNSLIREYKHAPDEVLALNNEIEDYRIVLSQLEDAATQIRSSATLARLDKILVEADQKVNELQDLVEVFERKGRKGKLSLFKAWKKRRREVGDWRDEVGRLKQDVVILLGAETSMSTSRIESSLDGFSVRFGMMQTRLLAETHNFQNETRDMMSLQSTSLCTVEKGQREMQANQDQMISMLATLLAQADLSNQAKCENQSGAPKVIDDDLNAIVAQPGGSFLPPDFLSVTVSRKTRLGCKLECSCCCHRRTSVKTPEALRRFIGGLNIGYNGSFLPWGKYCDLRSCKGSHKAISCNYHFPEWWTNKIISSSFFFGGPVLQISVRNTLTSDTKLYVDALGKEVSLSSLRAQHAFLFVNLIRNGTISLLDRVAIRGSSQMADKSRTLLVDLMSTPTDLLYVSTVMTLNPDFESQEDDGYTIGATIGNIWFFGFPRTIKNLIMLESKLNYNPLFEGIEATLWHRLSYHPFTEDSQKRLRYEGYDIETRDVFGRTPLHWACRFLNKELVKELLSLRADPTARDMEGRTPMHYLIWYMWSGRDCSFHGYPLMGSDKPCKCFLDTLEIISLLRSAGANMNAVDNCGRNVVFPFDTQRYPSIMLLERLVNCGLDINFKSPAGDIALLERFNPRISEHHRLLAWATTRGFLYYRLNSAGETILFGIARHTASTLKYKACRRSRKKWGENVDEVMIESLAMELQLLRNTDFRQLDTSICSEREGCDVRATFRYQFTECDLEELRRQQRFKYYNEFLDLLDEIDRQHDAYLGKPPRVVLIDDDEVEDDDDDDDLEFEDALEELH